jgi:hypothetical protein
VFELTVFELTVFELTVFELTVFELTVFELTVFELVYGSYFRSIWSSHSKSWLAHSAVSIQL